MTQRNILFLWTGTFFLCSFFVLAANANDTWFIDTRPATLLSKGEHVDHLTVAQTQQDDTGRIQWVRSTKEMFLETHNPNLPLVILIHGNWMTGSEAKSYGLQFGRLSQKIGEQRLLIWSWPAERTDQRIRQDALLKAHRADVQARFLAAFLRKLPPDSKVSLIGFSFGAKLACMTLQLMADTREHPHLGEDGKYGHSLQFRAILLAAAMDQQSLAPGRQYGKALSVTEKLLVHVNQNDSKLKWYPLLNGCGGPKAMGREGVPMGNLPSEYRAKIRSRDLHRLIGHDHGFMPSVLGLLAFREDFRHFVLFE